MTFSYDLNFSSPKDEVRLLIRDTNEDNPLLQNEEIAFLLAQANDSIYGAAALACRVIASHSAQAADKQVGDLKITYSNRSKQYADLASAFEERAGTSGAPAVVPYVGGMRYSDKEIDEQDPDIVPTFVRQGQTDNPPHSGSDPRIRW